MGLRDAVGRVSIRVPDALTVEEGDTARDLHANQHWGGGPRAEWDLYLRPTRTGKFTVRGWVRIPRGAPLSWDESECALDLDVRADTVVVSRFSTSLRHERVVGAQRFRYGGKHMVLINEPEPWLPKLGPASTPEPIEHPEAVCADCGIAEAKVLRYVVTVGTDGTVCWIEPRPADEAPMEPRVLAAAEATLKRWRFRPARARNRVIANWAEVDVTVLPGSR